MYQLKIIPIAMTVILSFTANITAYANDILDKDYIETEIWEEIWLGKDDDGTDFPEASYKHHLLDKWLDENYGSDEYDWTEIGELKYAYKDYYADLTEDWNFEDDNNGNWTIETDNNLYSFSLNNGIWKMIDQNGNVVDSFQPFNTLESEDNTSSNNNIDNNGNASPRVIGEVAKETESASESVSENKLQTNNADNNSMLIPVIVAIGLFALIGAVLIFRKKK